jgi:hypothetical protein
MNKATMNHSGKPRKGPSFATYASQPAAAAIGTSGIAEPPVEVTAPAPPDPPVPDKAAMSAREYLVATGCEVREAPDSPPQEAEPAPLEFPKPWSKVPRPWQGRTIGCVVNAQQAIQELAAIAEAMKFNGSGFYGELRLVIPFQNGSAQGVKAGLEVGIR